VDSQQKTQRSSREKTKCKHTVSNPNYSTRLGWKWGKRGRAPPFIGETLTSLPHGRASARPHARVDALPGPRGPVAARRVTVHVRTRGHGPARTRERVRASVPRRRGRVSMPTGTRTRADARASACKTASAGKRGRARTSGRTFSSKNVLYDIPERKCLFLYLFV
jgi:hypothetical protein